MPKLDIVRFVRHVLNEKRPVEAIRRAGDRARDASRWGEAVAHYGEYLEQRPDNVEIRIQLGNCLKESGRLADALAAYNSAIRIDGANADAYLQRGHLFKVMGRVSEAIDDYRRSFSLEHENNPALPELLSLGVSVDEIEAVPSRGGSVDEIHRSVIYVDATDLIEYLRVNTSLSGIQRVLSHLVMFNAKSAGVNVDFIEFVLPDYNELKVYTVNKKVLQGLVGLLASGFPDRQALDRGLEAVMRSRMPVDMERGDTFLIAGAFWIFHRYDLLNILRNKFVKIAVFIHDLIQITNPEYVAPDATTVFRRSLVDVLSVCNFVMTNSHFVADDVRRYIKERMNFEIPVIAVPLATELNTRNYDSSRVYGEYIELAKEEYVLCVSTIEIRKNHWYLVKIWERLIELFDGNVPNLVFVGKWGWEIEALKKYLQNSDYLGGRLFIYNAISDNDLEFLYRNCLFTVYPSFAEGWGLPVGESLWYGKPCFASNATAIPEVGGSLCTYIDPFDIEDGLRKISRFLSDRPALKVWTTRVQTEFHPKTWEDFSAELFGVINQYARTHEPTHAGNNCILESGDVAIFGNDPLAQLDAKRMRLVTARMTRMSGWHALEAWGCWAARRRATLKFLTRLLPGTEISVYLHLKTADGDEAAECTIKINGITTFTDNLSPVPQWFAAHGIVGDQGSVEILLVSGKGFHHRHGRELYVGILGIAVIKAGDNDAEQRLLSQIIRKCGAPRFGANEISRVNGLADAASI